MDALTFSKRRMSREELIVGFGGSVAMHFVIFAAALILPRLAPHKSFQIPAYSVNLVSMQDLGSSGPAASKKGASDNSSSTSKTKSTQNPSSAASSRSRSGPVVPVKRLQFDAAKTRNETELKKIDVAEAPDVAESAVPGLSIDKNLEKLISKPKPRPRPSPISQDSGSENEKQSGEKGSATGSPSGDASKGNTGKGSKGNTEGSEAEGSGSVVNGVALGLYTGVVKDAIRRQWALPEFLKSQNLEAVLLVVVRRDGKILSLRFENKSGQALFDESAERAVRKADPLPPFPAIFSPRELEFEFHFKPEGLS